MAKVTTKLQVTVPKVIAERYGIRPGDVIEWVAAGDSIRVVPARSLEPRVDLPARLRLFDAATERQRARTTGARPVREARARGWTRQEFSAYGRAR